MKTILSLLLASLFATVQGAPVEIDSDDSFPKFAMRGTSLLSGLTCDVCKGIVTIIQKEINSSASEGNLIEKIINICVKLKLEDENVCKQIVPQYKTMTLTVFEEVALSPSEACGLLLGNNCGSRYNPFNQKWDVPLPNTPKPPVTPTQPPALSAPKNRILHLSDIHYDREYVPGLSNDCGEPLCCRPPNEKGSGNTSAGFWGDYRCDLPRWTLVDLLQNLAQNKEEFDWIYWTGDVPAHNIWNQSREDQVEMLKAVNNLIKKYLPDKPVFPAIGNHESSPCNSFPPPYINDENSNQWLLNAVTAEWSQWLPPGALKTVSKGGFYSVKIRKGLRVISLHTNYCYSFNWWLLINSTDPADQLRWLVNELQSAENAKEKVHIIAHIPPGHSDCIQVWSSNFHKIVNRYESTIIGQFYGHSHLDEIQIYYDEHNTTRPVNVAMIGPSVTTQTNNNPGYRIYTIDGEYNETTNALLDFEAYYMNITEANLTNKTRWIQEYVASRDYGMKNCFPTDFDDLVRRFQHNDDLFQAYYRHMSRSHPPKPVCNSKCKASKICAIKTSISHDHSLCDNLPDGLTVEEVHSIIEKQQTC